MSANVPCVRAFPASEHLRTAQAAPLYQHTSTDWVGGAVDENCGENPLASPVHAGSPGYMPASADSFVLRSCDHYRDRQQPAYEEYQHSNLSRMAREKNPPSPVVCAVHCAQFPPAVYL